jgi:hypothetical protein
MLFWVRSNGSMLYAPVKVSLKIHFGGWRFNQQPFYQSVFYCIMLIFVTE